MTQQPPSSATGGKSLKDLLFGRRTAERTEKARTEAFLDAVPAEYCGWATDGTLAYSTNFPALLGLETIRNIVDIQNALSPVDAAALESLFTRLQNTGEAFDVDVARSDRQLFFHLSGRRGHDVSRAEFYDILWLTDITARQRALDVKQAGGDAVTQERDRLQTALDQVPVPLWLRDFRADLVWCNRAYADLLGISPATVIADQKELQVKLLRKAVLPGRNTVRGLAQTALDNHSVEQWPAHVIADGRRRLLCISERPLGNMNMTLGMALDLTREEELETEHKRYASANSDLLEQLGTAIGIYDAEQRLEFFNTAFAQLWGLEETYLNSRPRLGDVMEKLREDRRLPEQADFRKFKQIWLNMFTSLLGPHEEMLYLPDNRALRMLVVPHPMGGLMMTFEDVTSRLELESSYNTLIAVQRETIDNLNEGVAVFGGDGRIRLWNPAFARLWGLHPEDLEGNPHISRLAERFATAFNASDWPKARNELVSQCLTHRPASGRLERNDGSQVAYSTVLLPDGGVLVTHVDVTDSARVENALREKNLALEATERLKLDFLANVSYQLRTPLSTIVGFTEILSKEYFGPLNARQKEYTSGMEEAGERLVALINDILDLSTIEAGYMTLDKAPVDVRRMLGDLQELTAEWARKERIEVKLDVARGVGKVTGDERRLKQAFLNLIRNAIANTPAGGTISLGAESRDGEVLLRVTDTGHGIAAEDQARIFEPFERAQHGHVNQNHAARSGAGLGLTLVKNIIEMHGGAINLSSAPEQGTEVAISLPRAV